MNRNALNFFFQTPIVLFLVCVCHFNSFQLGKLICWTHQASRKPVLRCRSYDVSFHLRTHFHFNLAWFVTDPSADLADYKRTVAAWLEGGGTFGLCGSPAAFCQDTQSRFFFSKVTSCVHRRDSSSHCLAAGSVCACRHMHLLPPRVYSCGPSFFFFFFRLNPSIIYVCDTIMVSGMSLSTTHI